MSLELKKIPYESWTKRYNTLMKNPYLAKKYNRAKRIKDIRKYIGEHTPELKRLAGKTVLEIGPGMGEWLEVCRAFGHNVIGIDAKIDDCEMGNEYIQMSKLMTDRQKLSVHYKGFDTYLKEPVNVLIPNNYIFYINMRGCIEQCFKDHMTGTPHRKTKKASGLRWNTDQATWDMFYTMFEEFNRILVDGGYLVIHANGSKNNAEYDNFILETAKKFPAFKLFKKIKKTFHKYKVMR